jgi:hypothetical protein
VGHVKSHFGLFGDSVTVDPFGDSGNLTQYRCMLCAECTIGLDIILDGPDGTP